MAHIKDTKSGKHKLCWWDLAGSYRSVTFPTRKAAERLRLEIETELAFGRDWEPPTPSYPPGLGTMMQVYTDDIARLRAAGTARTAGLQLDVFAAWLREAHGTDDPPVTVLSKDLLRAFHDSLTGRKESTRYKYVRRVEALWQWGANEEAYAPHVARPCKLAMRAGEAAVTVAPTWAEMDACIAACLDAWPGRGAREPNVPLHRLAVVLRFTGLRVQQAMGLRWDDLDLRRAELTVRPELGKSRSERRGRRMPVSPHFVTEVKGWGTREGWLVPSVRTGAQGRIARQRDIIRAWTRAGVRPEAFAGQSFHAFRKGFVTGLRRAGVDPDAIEFLVGHSAGLRGIYTDPEALPLRDAVATIPKVGAEANNVIGLEVSR